MAQQGWGWSDCNIATEVLAAPSPGDERLVPGGPLLMLDYRDRWYWAKRRRAGSSAE